MGSRRDDITNIDRVHITLHVLNPERPRGVIAQLEETYGISRQTVYDIAAKGKQVLLEGLQPGAHGPQPQEKTILVDRNRLLRGVVVLTGEGVSQRGVTRCLDEMLDTVLSSSWVNSSLAHIEDTAAKVNASWQPQVMETLSGDEIYSNGAPNLVVVGNESLYLYALTRQPDCDGETWGCVLLDSPAAPQFASDAGRGLAAGVKAAELEVHQLDWDHLLRPLWGHAARLERRAYAALLAVEERAVKFDQAHTPQRLANHLAVWEQLSATAEEHLVRCDAFWDLAQQVDAQFALIDIESGALRDPVAGAAILRRVGQQMQAWDGRIYQKLSRNLINWAEDLFHYHAVLEDALAPITARWGAPAVRALSRIWQIEADEHRHELPIVEQLARQSLWEASLDEACALLGPQQVWAAWADVRQVLARSWRGSMLAECANSLLRPLLAGRKHTDQGCLELFRFQHNVHIFERGKRAGYSPAQLVGLEIPNDPLTLLGLAPKFALEPDQSPASMLPDIPSLSAFSNVSLSLPVCQEVSI